MGSGSHTSVCSAVVAAENKASLGHIGPGGVMWEAGRPHNMQTAR